MFYLLTWFRLKRMHAGQERVGKENYGASHLERAVKIYIYIYVCVCVCVCACVCVCVEQPYPEWPPTGLHYNHSLWSTKSGDNAMYDQSQPGRLSDVCRWWVAGILKHSSALMALCCPTVNCYRRLGGCFAPTLVDWSIDDRNSTIRVKNYGPKVNFRLFFAARRYRRAWYMLRQLCPSLLECVRTV